MRSQPEEKPGRTANHTSALGMRDAFHECTTNKNICTCNVLRGHQVLKYFFKGSYETGGKKRNHSSDSKTQWRIWDLQNVLLTRLWRYYTWEPTGSPREMHAFVFQKCLMVSISIGQWTVWSLWQFYWTGTFPKCIVEADWFRYTLLKSQLSNWALRKEEAWSRALNFNRSTLNTFQEFGLILIWDMGCM